MTKLAQLIAELCPDGVPYKFLGEIATDMYRGAGIKREELSEDGEPCVRYGEIYTTYGIWFDTCVSRTHAGTKTFEYGDILFAITGERVDQIAKSCAYIGHETCYAGGDVVVMKHEQDPKYLAYALSTIEAQQQKSAGKVKSKVVHSSIPALKGIKIPLPPLPIQHEIVRILDHFAELTARKKQYEYYRDLLLTFEEPADRQTDRWVRWVRLGDVAALKSGKGISSFNISENKTEEFFIPCIGGNGHRGFVREYSYDGNYVIIGRQGALCGNVKRVSGKFYATEHAVVVDLKTGFDSSFAFHLLTNMNLNQYATKSAQPGLAVSNIEKLEIPLPSLEEQARIGAILDRFDALCNDLTHGLPAEIAARKRQYEYYRDKLLSFEEAAS